MDELQSGINWKKIPKLIIGRTSVPIYQKKVNINRIRYTFIDPVLSW